MVVGVLALQGDFAEHRDALERVGAASVEVRSLAQLEEVDALIIPGGESTTILKLIDRAEMRAPLVDRVREGMPVFGTCAGAIVVAKKSSDGEEPLGLMDIEVTRNAYGRQVDSFEAAIPVEGVGPVEGVFIRAPIIEEVSDEVEVLASWGDQPVLVRQGSMVASTFHPELTDDVRLHRWFVEMASAEAGRRAS